MLIGSDNRGRGAPNGGFGRSRALAASESRILPQLCYTLSWVLGLVRWFAFGRVRDQRTLRTRSWGDRPLGHWGPLGHHPLGSVCIVRSHRVVRSATITGVRSIGPWESPPALSCLWHSAGSSANRVRRSLSRHKEGPPKLWAAGAAATAPEVALLMNRAGSRPEWACRPGFR